MRSITIARNPVQANFRLFQVGDSALKTLPSVAINNLTLTNGGGTMGANPVQTGGAITSYAQLVLTGCTIQNNTAALGGGIYAEGGTLTTTNCTIFDNMAGSGAGIYIDVNVTEASITNGSIYGNQAFGSAFSAGGGIFIRGGEEVPINVLGVQIYTKQGDGVAAWRS
jgi:predicted outer membrane repeat protein